MVSLEWAYAELLSARWAVRLPVNDGPEPRPIVNHLW